MRILLAPGDESQRETSALAVMLAQQLGAELLTEDEETHDGLRPGLNLVATSPSRARELAARHRVPTWIAGPGGEVPASIRRVLVVAMQAGAPETGAAGKLARSLGADLDILLLPRPGELTDSVSRRTGTEGPDAIVLPLKAIQPPAGASKSPLVELLRDVPVVLIPG